MSLIDSNNSLKEIETTFLDALNRAGNDKHSAFRFIILNTLTDGFPNSRYVVLRKFKADSNELFIYTDYRSNKIEEIKANALASVLAYDKQNKVQLKLTGEISIHYHNEIANNHWEDLQGGKEAYNTKSQPGEEVDSLEEANQMKKQYDSEFFTVLTLKVSNAEVLQLNGSGHIRASFDFDKGRSTFLVP